MQENQSFLLSTVYLRLGSHAFTRLYEYVCFDWVSTIKVVNAKAKIFVMLAGCFKSQIGEDCTLTGHRWNWKCALLLLSQAENCKSICHCVPRRKGHSMDSFMTSLRNQMFFNSLTLSHLHLQVNSKTGRERQKRGLRARKLKTGGRKPIREKNLLWKLAWLVPISAYLSQIYIKLWLAGDMWAFGQYPKLENTTNYTCLCNDGTFLQAWLVYRLVIFFFGTLSAWLKRTTNRPLSPTNKTHSATLITTVCLIMHKR